MAIVKQPVGARTSLPFTTTSLSTLAAATYVQNTTAFDCSINQPLDVVVEVDISTTNIPAGNKQVVVFISGSLDGTNYRSGPTSGTITTREANLLMLGVVPITTASTPEIGLFSIATALGFVPLKFFVILKNDLGVALTSGTVFTSEISSSVV